jgi:hypothetical protein
MTPADSIGTGPSPSCSPTPPWPSSPGRRRQGHPTDQPPNQYVASRQRPRIATASCLEASVAHHLADLRRTSVVGSQRHRPRRTDAERGSRRHHLADLPRRGRPGRRGRPDHHQAHRPVQGPQTRTATPPTDGWPGPCHNDVRYREHLDRLAGAVTHQVALIRNGSSGARQSEAGPRFSRFSCSLGPRRVMAQTYRVMVRWLLSTGRVRLEG